MPGDIPAKSYFRIGEVARTLGVAAHVLRYWETEFRAVRPVKSPTGQRVYSRRDVERLDLIRKLLREERYTLEGARRALRERGLDDDANAPALPEVYRDALLRARDRLVALEASLDAIAEGGAPERVRDVPEPVGTQEFRARGDLP